MTDWLIPFSKSGPWRTQTFLLCETCPWEKSHFVIFPALLDNTPRRESNKHIINSKNTFNSIEIYCTYSNLKAFTKIDAAQHAIKLRQQKFSSCTNRHMLCGIDFHDNNRRKHVGWQHAYNVPWNCNECVTSITETWMLCCCRVCHPPCLSPILTIRGGKRIATWEPSSQKLFGI